MRWEEKKRKTLKWKSMWEGYAAEPKFWNKSCCFMCRVKQEKKHASSTDYKALFDTFTII